MPLAFEFFAAFGGVLGRLLSVVAAAFVPL
jgi:hypothetical protein